MVTFMKFIIASVLLISIGFHGQSQDLSEAIQYLKNRNYAAAVEICNQALADNTNNADALAIRSMVYSRTSRYDQALKDANSAVDANSSSEKAHYAKGEALYGLKDYNNALAEYDMAIKANSNYPESYSGKARTYMALQNYKDALTVVENALKTFPEDVELNYTHGLLNTQRGKPRLAIDDYNKTLALDPQWNLSQVYFNRGLAYEALLDYVPAIEDLTKAITIDPNNAGAYIARGNMQYTTGKYNEALADYAKAEVFNPDNAILTYNIAMTYYKNENKSAACKYFQKSCSLGNNNACKMAVLNCSDRTVR